MKNPSPDLAFFIRTSIHKGKEGEEVLPSFWSDNYFHILPGGKKETKVQFPELETKKLSLYLKVEGWNIPPRWIPIER